MMFAIAGVAYVFLIGFIIARGHKKAVEKSEASLRAKYEKGELSEESRVLMRAAGYNV